MEPRDLFLCSLLLMAASGMSACDGWERRTDKPGSSESELPNGILGGVSALFRNDNPAIFSLIGPSGFTLAPLTTYRQVDSGALTSLANFRLSGASMQLGDVSGNADFALGRWSAGTLTTPQGSTEILDGSPRWSWHYLLIKPLRAMPGNWTYRCGAPRVTTITFVNGTNIDSNQQAGTVGGKASFSILNSVATVDFQLVAMAGGKKGGLKGKSIFTRSDAVQSHEDFDSGGIGAKIMLGSAADGGIHVAMPYRVRLENGAIFHGIAVFPCAA
ncbi:hypothetical protein AB4Z48_10055 [Cupriavidus sp. 2TAF22]|uniref:hypothetical protein n=1 Tax=unclassified Cupriavidus TaxID=2640874 RepID=UPI003F92182B